MSIPDLIASYWTIAGDASPLAGNGLSPHSFRDRVEVAARAGFRGIGSSHADLVRNVAQYGYAGIKAILDANDMRYFEIEALLDWFADGDRRRRSDVVRDEMLRAAEKVGAYQIKIVGDLYGEWSIAQMADAYRLLCMQAMSAGTRISLELLPFTNIKDLGSGLAVVGDPSIKNGGLLLDIWHINRGRIPYSQVAKLPGQFVAAIELNDGPQDIVEPLLTESVERRELCGEGDFDVPAFITSLAAVGYQGPFGVEILSPKNRERSLADAARLTFASTIRQFAS